MLIVKTRIAPSAIQGIGLFAMEFIPKGTVIWEFTPGFDAYVKAEDVHRLPLPAKFQMLKYCHRDQVTGHYVLCADDARYFNHSEVAARDIQPGEELTCDYRLFDADVQVKLHMTPP